MGYDALVDSARLNGALTATAEAIRNKTDSAEPITFDMDEGFKSAVEGIATGGGDTEAAFQEGERAVWNVIQQGGARVNYSSGFYEGDAVNPVWTDNTFKPIYDMRPRAVHSMFRGTGITDLPAICERQNIVFDTSNCTAFNTFVAYSKYIVNLGTISGVSATDFPDSFRAGKLKTMKLILKEDGTQKFTRSFDEAISLENITFEGVIGNDINFSVCPLSKASFINIFEHFSTTASFTATFQKTAKEANFTADEWTALVGTRPNVTIVLK